MKLKQKYALSKGANVGDTCSCPSCDAEFIKEQPQQAFCKTKPGTQCKDKYWNTVTPNKRNNTSRISPASDAYMKRNGIGAYNEYIDEGPEGWDGHKRY